MARPWSCRSGSTPFPPPSLNRQLYLWLAALAVAAQPCDDFHADPLRRDIARLRQIFLDCEKAVALFPGLAPIRAALGAQTLASRPPFQGPAVETQLEAWICAWLAGEPLKTTTPMERALAGDAAALQELDASPSYKTYRPALMWGERVAPPASGGETSRRRRAGAGRRLCRRRGKNPEGRTAKERPGGAARQPDPASFRIDPFLRRFPQHQQGRR